MSNEHSPVVRLRDYPRRHAQQSASPFRYPGGKGFLTGYLSGVLEKMSGSDMIYAEPFCGGAGAAINLLRDGTCNEIHLNDLDARIYSAWCAIVKETDRFLERLDRVSVDVETWRRSREIISSSSSGYDFETGFAAYFLNRTSRAGIILGSGPIGGYDQKSNWNIDARFYRESMKLRISWIGSQRDRIFLSNKPALDFLRDHASTHDTNKTLYFIDPPYVVAGSRLYLDSMDLASHRALSDYLKSGSLPHWVLTYDNDPLIRKLYAGCNVRELEVNYSLRNTRKAKEVLIQMN